MTNRENELRVAPEEMTDDEMILAIAKAHGWVKLDKPIRFNLGFRGWINCLWQAPKQRGTLLAEEKCPDYLNDLNAMRDVEGILTVAQIPQWIKNLADLTITSACYGPCDHSYQMLRATARQRATAFIKTIRSDPEGWPISTTRTPTPKS